MRLCVLESGEDIMSSSARWSWKKRAFSATTNDNGNHCEKQEGDSQNTTTCSVKFSSVRSKTDGAEPLVMSLGAGSVPL